MWYEPNWKEEAIIELVGMAGLYKWQLSGGQKRKILISCPYAPYSNSHKSDLDRHPSMSVLTDEDEPFLINCFTCGAKHRSLKELIATLAMYDPIWHNYSSWAYDTEYVDLRTPFDRAMTDRVVERDEVAFDDDMYDFQPALHPYLANRGMTLETAKAWEVGYDREESRVTFPIRDYDGVLVGAVGRGIHDFVKPRYSFYWEAPAREHLFGLWMARPNTTWIVQEGTIDVPIVWQELNELGLLHEYSVVGTNGTRVTDTQCEEMVRYAKDVITAMDNDAAGRDARQTIIDRVGRRTHLRHFWWAPELKDASDDPKRFVKGLPYASTIIKDLPLQTAHNILTLGIPYKQVENRPTWGT